MNSLQPRRPEGHGPIHAPPHAIHPEVRPVLPVRTLPAWESSAESISAGSRVSEFIGTMSCKAGITTSEFEARCKRWLTDLLGTRNS
jgi:hypothetical protein